ncbi:fatty acid desaturase-domain-containing protein [Zopfochytrium polystomum]|nr:fatty acid desaturase-domain-containing protein [Zopfochytrium polystomum]
MVAATQTTTQQPRKITWAEIELSAAKKRTIQDVESGGPAYLVIHNKVYDVGQDTGFLAAHPGGAVVISQIGKDGSGAFEVFHTANAEAIMSEYYVGDLAEAEPTTELTKDIDQLRDTLIKSGAFESSKLYYLGKLIQLLSIVGLSFAIIAKWGTTSTLAVFVAGAILALFWQQSGWLAHDVLHHQLFKNRNYNNALGFVLGNVFQGFSVHWWKNKHCTHHSVPNVHLEDPDIDTMPFLAWSEHALELFTDMKDSDVAHFMVAYQPILYFPILAAARLAWAVSSLKYVFKGLVRDPTYALAEKATLILHWAIYLAATFTFCSPLRGLLYIFVSQTFCGILLAIVFSVNHNGMPVFTRKAASKVNFYELQIVTGRDVISTPFSDWFTGGLNYQIEHHMFPTLPRHQFHKAQPLVESLCKKHGIVYHKTTLWTGVVEIVQRLASISRLASKVRA